MQKKIVYTPHLKFRLKLREIPPDLQEKIYQKAKERYIDRETDKSVAVLKMRYKGKAREMSVIYKETDIDVRLITIHPLKSYQKVSRINSGRWQII